MFSVILALYLLIGGVFWLFPWEDTTCAVQTSRGDVVIASSDRLVSDLWNDKYDDIDGSITIKAEALDAFGRWGGESAGQKGLKWCCIAHFR